MNGLLGDVLIVGLLIVVVFFWNYFIVPMTVDGVLRMNGARQSRYLNYLRENRNQVIKTFQVFYWVGLVIILIGLLFLA